jgi:ADP-ribosylglycohydrolase
MRNSLLKNTADKAYLVTIITMIWNRINNSLEKLLKMKLKIQLLMGSMLLSLFINIPLYSKVLLNEAEFRDHIYACWLGKNIGGTLGMPFEGKKGLNNISFYTNLKSGEPAANDDLDLQILWLKAMQENSARVDAYKLGEYWLKYVPVNWNEYGVCKENMKVGIMPPLSGEYNNQKWKNSNGAWIRSEIWACLAPGCPLLAAQMAREDACVDHGTAEGTLAEIFTASIESAAFIESDRDKLINFGLSMIPENCRVARAVRTAIAAKRAGKDWQTARAEVIKDTEDMGWFQAPANVAFTIIGWLYGDGDFGKSICIAINCGDDTDCTGATLGSILGIIGGTKAIPEKWRKPIGDKIKTVAISGFQTPENLSVLTNQTLAMTKKVLIMNNAPVTITDRKTDLLEAKNLLSIDQNALHSLWNLSPYQIIKNERGLTIVIDYQSDPLIQSNVPRTIHVVVKNQTLITKSLELRLLGLPKNWKFTGLPDKAVDLKSYDSKTYTLSFLAPEIKSYVNTMKLNVTEGTSSVSIPLTLFYPIANEKK